MDNQEAQVLELKHAGYTNMRIAAVLHMDSKKIGKIVSAHGLASSKASHKKSPTPTLKEYESVDLLFRNGHTKKEVAKALKISTFRVDTIISWAENTPSERAMIGKLVAKPVRETYQSIITPIPRERLMAGR